MFNIELPDALELFKLPRKLGNLPGGEPVSANTGMFGPYVQYETVDKETGEVVKKYASLQAADPLTVTLEEAIEVIRAKQEADAKKLVKDFGVDGIRILNGRWGPYLADAERNARIPKGREPESITLEEAQQLLAAAPVRKRRWAKKVVKKAPRKTAKKPKAESGGAAGAVKKPATRKKAGIKKKTGTKKKAAKAVLG
jgi:DNA topoisomerase-1